MARITVEDCLKHVDNRFDLVLLATRRARQLANKVEPTLPWQNDKPTVLALREIAAGNITSAMIQAAQRQLDEAAAVAATASSVSVEEAIAAEFAAGLAESHLVYEAPPAPAETVLPEAADSGEELADDDAALGDGLPPDLLSLDDVLADDDARDDHPED